MTYRFVYSACFLIFLLTFGCRPPKESPGLSDEQMSRIMADLFVAEAATNSLSGYVKDSLTHVYYNQVFEIHGVTPEEYERSLRLLVSEESRIEKVVKEAIALVKSEKASNTEKEKEEE